MVALRYLILGCMVALLLLPDGAFARKDRPAAEQIRIEALLDAIKQSQASFIRNGDEHSPEKAVEHLRNKLDYVGDDVQTAEEFIRHLASKSSFSGKKYMIRLPDGTTTPSGEWLTEALQNIDRKTLSNQPVQQ